MTKSLIFTYHNSLVLGEKKNSLVLGEKIKYMYTFNIFNSNKTQ